MAGALKLQNGFYKIAGHWLQTWKINGSNIEMNDAYDLFQVNNCSVEYGNFGKLR